MKKYLLTAALMISSSVAFASSIQLKPGETVTLEPNEISSVSCGAEEFAKDFKCTLSPEGNLWVMRVNGVMISSWESKDFEIAMNKVNDFKMKGLCI